MSSEKPVPVEMRLQYVVDQRELVHLLPHDLICATAQEAIDEIVWLRACWSKSSDRTDWYYELSETQADEMAVFRGRLAVLRDHEVEAETDYGSCLLTCSTCREDWPCTAVRSAQGVDNEQ